MGSRSWEECALDFYYGGFYRALKRFRAYAVIGWAIAFVGVTGLFFGWDFARRGGWMEFTLCAGAVLAGIAVVQAGVAGLSAYVRVPWHWPASADGVPEHLRALRDVMETVDRGGWREAAGALESLQKIGRAAGLAPPGG